MILRLALRSLATRPVRTAVLACGFGFGIAVMAALLGVGDVILEQAHSPALEGGGDVVISGRFGPLENARFLIASVLGSPDIAAQTVGVAPSKKASLYLLKDGRATAVAVTGGLPGADHAVGLANGTDALQLSLTALGLSGDTLPQFVELVQVVLQLRQHLEHLLLKQRGIGLQGVQLGDPALGNLLNAVVEQFLDMVLDGNRFRAGGKLGDGGLVGHGISFLG